MKEWFLSREPRERLILAVGAVVVVTLVGWLLVWKPLSDGVESLSSTVDRQSLLLVDAQRAAAVDLDDPSRARSEQSLLVLVDRTAEAHGIGFTRTRPDGATGIDVSFQSAAFDALLDWLVTLETEHGVSVESAQSIRAAREPGLVDGQLVLRRY